MTTRSRFLGVGVALGLAAGLLVGAGLAGPGQAAAAAPSVAPGAPPAASLSEHRPRFPRSRQVGSRSPPPARPSPTHTSLVPGRGPDHTIVVTGVGTADLKSDGSDQAAQPRRAPSRPRSPTRSRRPTSSPPTPG